MKKILLFSLLLFFLSGGVVSAQDEEIKDFSVVIDIERDSQIKVQEKITYDFAVNKKHGIFREIPYRYKARGGFFELRIDDVAVFDASKTEIPFSLSKSDGKLRIKIGNPDKLVTGLRVYEIHYSVRRAINFFDEHDELYWNVTGDEWEAVIRQSKVEVNLPGISDEEMTKADCFAGAAGSNNKCVSSRFIYSGKAQVKSMTFIEDKLSPGQGFTIVAGFEKGLIEEPSYASVFAETVKDNLIVGLPVLTLLFMLWLWQRFGRDPEARGTIVAEYEVPDNLSPAEIGTVLDEKTHNYDISAELIELAVKGYIKIKKVRKEGVFGGKDYELTRVRQVDSSLFKHQKYLLEKIFQKKFIVDDSVHEKVVRLSELKMKFAEYIRVCRKKIYTAVVDKGYFSKSPAKVRGRYTALGVLAMIAAWFAGPLLDWIGVISIAASGFIILAFSFLMPRKTIKGARLQERILGFKDYLQVAEKDRIDFHSGPKKDPKTFEKFLPFAMALRVEKEWAKQFADVYSKEPSWYSDPSQGAFSAVAFSNDMKSFGKSAQSAMTTTKSSSGGSGFSGGGSGGGFGGGSGGGFGGGGGGSW